METWQCPRVQLAGTGEPPKDQLCGDMGAPQVPTVWGHGSPPGSKCAGTGEPHNDQLWGDMAAPQGPTVWAHGSPPRTNCAGTGQPPRVLLWGDKAAPQGPTVQGTQEPPRVLLCGDVGWVDRLPHEESRGSAGSPLWATGLDSGVPTGDQVGSVKDLSPRGRGPGKRTLQAVLLSSVSPGGPYARKVGSWPPWRQGGSGEAKSDPAPECTRATPGPWPRPSRPHSHS